MKTFWVLVGILAVVTATCMFCSVQAARAEVYELPSLLY